MACRKVNIRTSTIEYAILHFFKIYLHSKELSVIMSIG